MFKNIIRIAQVPLLLYLSYYMYLLLQKDSKQIEEEYKDSKFFLFILVSSFLSLLFAVGRDIFGIYKD
jgi:ACR3 family arsenite efflux pump ArsB